MKSWLDIIILIECFFLYSINYSISLTNVANRTFLFVLYENSVESRCESVMNPIFDTILRQNDLGNPHLKKKCQGSFYLS